MMTWYKVLKYGDTSSFLGWKSFNSLAPGRFECKFRQAIFKIILLIDGSGNCCKIALGRMSLHLTATSHYMSQHWPSSVLPCGITGRQWVKTMMCSWAESAWLVQNCSKIISLEFGSERRFTRFQWWARKWFVKFGPVIWQGLFVGTWDLLRVLLWWEELWHSVKQTVKNELQYVYF